MTAPGLSKWPASYRRTDGECRRTGVQADRATQKSTLSIFNGHASSGGGGVGSSGSGSSSGGGGRFVFLSSSFVAAQAGRSKASPL